MAGGGALWLGRKASLHGAPDRASAGSAVFEYLRALEGQDPGRVARLVMPAGERARDVDERLRRFGGASATKADVEIGSLTSSDDLSVTIRTVSGAGEALAWTEHLVWSDGRWQLATGGARALGSVERSAP